MKDTLKRVKNASLIVLVAASLCLTPSPAAATSVLNVSSESRPDQWLFGIELSLTAQNNPPFQRTFNFANSTLTKAVHISYRCSACGTVLFYVRLADGSQLFGPITLDGTVNSEVVEYTVNSKTINSVTVFVGSSATGTFEVQMMGTQT